jgi:hypothetical protein
VNYYRLGLVLVALACANAAACSNCAKDDSAPAAPPPSGPPPPASNLPMAPMPHGFVKRTLPLATANPNQVVDDAGADAGATRNTP